MISIGFLLISIDFNLILYWFSIDCRWLTTHVYLPSIYIYFYRFSIDFQWLSIDFYWSSIYLFAFSSEFLLISTYYPPISVDIYRAPCKNLLLNIQARVRQRLWVKPCDAMHIYIYMYISLKKPPHTANSKPKKKIQEISRETYCSYE